MKIILGPAAEDEFYFERPQLNKLFWKTIKESHNVAIAAPRRVGKSSFMLNLLRTENPGYTCIYLITESINRPNEFFKKIYKTLLSQLSDGQKYKQFIDDAIKRQKLKKIALSGVEFENEDVNFHEEILMLCREIKNMDRRIVLLIDEFSQTLENIITDQGLSVAKIFLHQCRELQQAHDVKSKLNFVYTGSIGLENLVSSIGESRAINFGTLKIPPFSKAEAQLLITRILGDDPIEFGEEEQAYLLNKLNWLLPYFIQMIMSEIGTICEERGLTRISNVIIDEAFDKALDNRSYFEHWLSRLKVIFKGKDFSCVKEILKKAALNNGIDAYEIQDALTKYDVEEAAPIMNTLLHDGYHIKDEAINKYRFYSPLLQAWWLKAMVL